MLAVATMLFVAAGSAAAHVSADPTSVPANRPVSVAFIVPHGCEGSPTIRLRFAVPNGFSAMSGAPKAGWVVENTAQTVTFSGPQLDASSVEQFHLVFIAAGPDRTVYLPLVQTCVNGELAWIDLPQPGGPEPRYPAPAVVISGSSPSVAVAVAGQAATASTEAAAPVVTSVAPRPSSIASSSTTVTEGRERNGSTALRLAIAAIVLVASGAFGVRVMLRRGPRPNPPTHR